MRNKRFIYRENKNNILVELAVSIRNSGYLLLTSGILSLLIGFLSALKFLNRLSLGELLTFLKTGFNDFEFIFVLDSYINPVFGIILGFYAIKSYQNILAILERLDNCPDLFLRLFKFLTRFFQTIFIFFAVYICLFLLKMILF